MNRVLPRKLMGVLQGLATLGGSRDQSSMRAVASALDCDVRSGRFRPEGEFGGSRMRTLALAAVIGAGLTLGGIAFAEQWNDPNGRLTFNAPSGWRVQPRNATGGTTAVLAFNPTNDCYFFGLPNPNNAGNAATTRGATAQLSAEAWATAAAPVRDFFEGAPATVVSQSVDTSGFWPVQRAELRGPSKTVYGAILARPGAEIRAFCSGATSAAAYDSIFASLGHPNDATWQGEAAGQAAARAAQQEAAAAAAQQQQEQQAQAQEEAQPAICNDPNVPSRDPRRRRCN
jgi:hypothetical protein